jgi:hypothetical protein
MVLTKQQTQLKVGQFVSQAFQARIRNIISPCNKRPCYTGTTMASRKPAVVTPYSTGAVHIDYTIQLSETETSRGLGSSRECGAWTYCLGGHIVDRFVLALVFVHPNSMPRPRAPY